MRIIAATNRNLEEMIKTGAFREDLYHRLDVVKLTLPHAARTQRGHRRFGELLHGEVRQRMQASGERNNTRSASAAKHIVGRAISANWKMPSNAQLCWDLQTMIGIEDLPRRIFDAPDGAHLPATYDEAVKDAKRHVVLNALATAKGNYTEAARTLGIHANNLHRLIRTLDLKAATGKMAASMVGLLQPSRLRLGS